MDDDLSRELDAFCPSWRLPRTRLDLAPDLPWLSVLLDEDRAGPGSEVDLAISAVRAAADRLADLDMEPGRLEIWLEATPAFAGGAGGVGGPFRDGVFRLALAEWASPFDIVHEAAHFITISAASVPPHRAGAERLAAILLEEYLAQRIGIALLADLAIDTPKILAREARSQARQVVADYRAARTAFRILIESAVRPDELKERTFALVRTFAYLAGASQMDGQPPIRLIGLPGGLTRLVSGRLRPALARLELPADLGAERMSLIARLNLVEIVTDLLSEVVSNALLVTPVAHRHPNWPEAFGRPA